MLHVHVDYRNVPGGIPKAFYVGVGTSTRVRKLGRNELHTQLGAPYGWYRVVVNTFETRQEALLMERFLIRALEVRSTQGGANKSEGGDGGGPGKRHTLESRAKLRAFMLGNTHAKGKRLFRTPEHRANLSASQKGKPRRSESISRMAATKVGVKLTEEHRINIGNALRGKTLASDELKTHCVNGHLFDAENTYTRRTGGRACRACHREIEVRRRASNPQQGASKCLTA